MVVHEMTKSECLAALTTARLGRLGCARDYQPYVVPIYFVYEEPYLYGFTTPGLKVEWMRSNPLVCVEVDAVDRTEHWMSIIIFGEYQELSGSLNDELVTPRKHWSSPQGSGNGWTEFIAEKQAHAYELLQRHAGWWDPGCASRLQCTPSGEVAPLFYRVRINRVSGRRAIPNSAARSPSTVGVAGRHNEGALHRLWHWLARPLWGTLPGCLPVLRR